MRFIFLIWCNQLIFSSFLLPWVVQCQGLSFFFASQFLCYLSSAVRKSRHIREQKFQSQWSSSFHTWNKCMLPFWQESSVENISGVIWRNPKEGLAPFPSLGILVIFKIPEEPHEVSRDGMHAWASPDRHPLLSRTEHFIVYLFLFKSRFRWFRKQEVLRRNHAKFHFSPVRFLWGPHSSSMEPVY